MRIGEISARAGVNVQTIRFYEREKLLRKPLRTVSGYRKFEEGDLERVRFIKDSQRLGFSLKEIKELLEIHESAKSFAGGTQRKSKSKEGRRSWIPYARSSRSELFPEPRPEMHAEVF